MIYSIRSTSYLWHKSSSLHLVLMKLIAVVTILCYSTYQNNSNYLLLFIGFYLYSMGAKVNAITFFNHIELLVLYNILYIKF